MLLHKDQFPITIQAYEINNDVELFIAEQVVNNQAEVDTFSNRYAGKLIKAKAFSTPGSDRKGDVETRTTTTRKETGKSSAGTIILVIVIILIILIAIGFYTGWIQQNTGITL